MRILWLLVIAHKDLSAIRLLTSGFIVEIAGSGHNGNKVGGGLLYATACPRSRRGGGLLCLSQQAWRTYINYILTRTLYQIRLYSYPQLVDGVISQDSDCFAYGAVRVYRNFSVSTQGAQAAAGGAVDIYDMREITSRMDFGQQKIIVMALLCGCDESLWK